MVGNAGDRALALGRLAKHLLETSARLNQEATAEVMAGSIFSP